MSQGHGRPVPLLARADCRLCE